MNEIELIRSECINDFEFFTRYMFKKKTGKKFIVSEHHKELFRQATAIAEGKQHNSIFNIAPRYSKTEIMVKNFIAWSLAVNPKAKFIHLSYSDQLALDNSEEVKDMINTDWYQELFPYVQIKKDSKAKNKWYTTAGGGVLARAAGGQVTGFGAGTIEDDGVFGGAIIIDDPLKPDDALSETQRSKVNNRYDTTIKNRVNSRKTPIIVIMQRLHDEDLTGYLLEQSPDDWHHTSMPAIKEDGTALWEFKHTIEELEKLKEENEHVFETQYMQNPQPLEGLLFHKDKINYYNGELDTKKKIATLSAIDIADGGGDFHCVLIAYLIENKVFIHDVIFTKAQMLAYGDGGNLDRTIKILNEYKPERALMEINYSGTTYPGEVRKRLNGITGLATHKATTNKHGRIMTEAGFIQKHFYFRSDNPHEEYKEFMSWLFKYDKEGNVKHDDGVDTLQILSSKIKVYYGYLWD